MNALFALPLNGAPAVLALPLAGEITQRDAFFATLCETRARLVADGVLMVHEAADELQGIAKMSGLIDRIGQDEAQRIMGEVFAAVDSLPDDELSEACEAEIMLRTADLVRQWEAADKPRPEPPRRPEPYKPAESTVAAFWYVVGLDDADYLARWLRSHQSDAPALLKILDGGKR